MERHGWMVARKLVGKSAGALGIHKVLGDASWVRVRLPGKAGGNDKEGEGRTPRPGALKLQEGGSDVTVGTKGVFLLRKWMCKFQN